MHSSLPLSIASALVLVACGPGGDGPIDGELPCESGLLTGDLVITEVMANPEGNDEGNEYFEIYNATGATVDLTGLRLEKAAIDGGDVEQHIMTGTTIDSGAFVALGGVLQEFRAPYIAYGYGTGLGSRGLPNAGGQLSVHCAGTEIDRVFYGDATSGHSQGLDGNITPDHLSNDDIANYCDATTEYATGAFGSPGASNEPCSIVEQTTCIGTDGKVREVVQPGVGDLVITEFLANPSGTDAAKEWFEVQATASFDLNGLVAGKVPADPKVNIIDENCLVASPGDRIVFARSADVLINGGLPLVDYTFNFSLNNTMTMTTTPSLFVGVGVTVIDTITWTSSSTGKSAALDSAQIDATANDDEGNWCDGKTAYGDGDQGTPGAANPLCDTSGMCMDGASLRATVPPLAADVSITEWMPDPVVVSDFDGEWFEVHFAASADLNGIQVGKDVGPPQIATTTLNSPDCIAVPADTYVVFARKTDPMVNGGLPVTNIHAYSSITLGKTAATTYTIFVGLDGVVFDQVDYLGADVLQAGGASRQIDSVGATCNGTDVYGVVANGNLGTPGLANNDCP